jgi:UDP-N-acetylglucosamine:LPS N-acetylglucosamine transferase
MKIAAGASAGGHMNELQCLLQTETGNKIQPHIYLSTNEIIRSSLDSENTPIYILGECNREDFWKIPLVFLKAFIVALKTRPDVVISTGALPIAIYAFIAQKLGAKVIWIDSIANIDKLSMSGRWALKFADKIYTQWPELANEKIQYKGHLI